MCFVANRIHNSVSWENPVVVQPLFKSNKSLLFCTCEMRKIPLLAHHRKASLAKLASIPKLHLTLLRFIRGEEEEREFLVNSAKSLKKHGFE